MIPKCKQNKQNNSELENRVQALETAISSKANTKRITNCDMNELVSEGSGLFVCMAQLSNAPTNASNSHYYTIQIVYNKDYAVQYALSLHSIRVVYIRRKIEGTWDSWTQL